MMNSVLQLMWVRIALITAVVIAIGAGAFVLVKRRPIGPEFVEVRRGTAVQEVIVTGKTKPVRDANLAFERTGRVSSVHAAVGDQLAAGVAVATGLVFGLYPARQASRKDPIEALRYE